MRFFFKQLSAFLGLDSISDGVFHLNFLNPSQKTLGQD
jgi:hypothetical protein